MLERSKESSKWLARDHPGKQQKGLKYLTTVVSHSQMSLKAGLRESPEEFTGIICLVWDIRVVQLHGSRASGFGSQVWYLSCAKPTHFPCVWLQVCLNSLCSVAWSYWLPPKSSQVRVQYLLDWWKFVTNSCRSCLRTMLLFRTLKLVSVHLTGKCQGWCRQQKAGWNCWSLPKMLSDNKQKAAPKRCSQGSSLPLCFQICIFPLVEFSWCA